MCMYVCMYIYIYILFLGIVGCLELVFLVVVAAAAVVVFLLIFLCLGFGCCCYYMLCWSNTHVLLLCYLVWIFAVDLLLWLFCHVVCPGFFGYVVAWIAICEVD